MRDTTDGDTNKCDIVSTEEERNINERQDRDWDINNASSLTHGARVTMVQAVWRTVTSLFTPSATHLHGI